jgi:hypothetical protein
MIKDRIGPPTFLEMAGSKKPEIDWDGETVKKWYREYENERTSELLEAAEEVITALKALKEKVDATNNKENKFERLYRKFEATRGELDVLVLQRDVETTQFWKGPYEPYSEENRVVSKKGSHLHGFDSPEEDLWFDIYIALEDVVYNSDPPKISEWLLEDAIEDFEKEYQELLERKGDA